MMTLSENWFNVDSMLCACWSRPNAKIGIKHMFSPINNCQVLRVLLKTEAEGRGFQQAPRELANVNAIKTQV